MEKIFIPHQLKALLPSDMYKVLDTLFAFQKEGTITYSKRNAEFLHLDQAVADQAIQTAVDKKIIEPLEMTGGVYKFKINKPLMETAKTLSLTDIPNRQLIRLSEEITFKNDMKPKEPSTADLLEEIRILKEKLMNQVKDNNDSNDLPW